MYMWTIVGAIYVILFVRPLPAERILVLTGAPFYSHQVVYRSLNLALHKRGHELVVFTTVPMKDPTLKNYTEIDMSHTMLLMSHYKETRWKMSQVESCKEAIIMIKKFGEAAFLMPEFHELYKNSSQKFDVVIIEAFNDLSIYALVYKLNIPIVGILSLGLHNYHRYVYGASVLPSHPSNWEVNTLIEDDSSFWQRLRNFIDTWALVYFWINQNLSMRDSVKKKLGNDIPYDFDLMKKTSILLINEHPLFVHTRPEQPNTIFFTGIHIEKTPPTLPKELGRFLDDATKGFIYVSFGTAISCHDLPKEIVQMFVNVFANLSLKVVWKSECDEWTGKFDNVFISKWFPQQGVLAHPNIRLFIYQGGQQSSEEAVYYAVPLLGIPIMLEQTTRIQRLVSLGAAMYLKLRELNEERLGTAINQMLSDKSYKERIAHLSELYKDQPYDSLENAVWWVEYVMRHKGISYLRYSESDKPWYQRHDMDIVAFLSTMLFIATCVTALVLFRLLRTLWFVLRRYSLAPAYRPISAEAKNR